MMSSYLCRRFGSAGAGSRGPPGMISIICGLTWDFSRREYECDSDEELWLVGRQDD